MALPTEPSPLTAASPCRTPTSAVAPCRTPSPLAAMAHQPCWLDAAAAGCLPRVHASALRLGSPRSCSRLYTAARPVPGWLRRSATSRLPSSPVMRIGIAWSWRARCRPGRLPQRSWRRPSPLRRARIKPWLLPPSCGNRRSGAAALQRKAEACADRDAAVKRRKAVEADLMAKEARIEELRPLMAAASRTATAKSRKAAAAACADAAAASHPGGDRSARRRSCHWISCPDAAR